MFPYPSYISILMQEISNSISQANFYSKIINLIESGVQMIQVKCYDDCIVVNTAAKYTFEVI